MTDLHKSLLTPTFLAFVVVFGLSTSVSAATPPDSCFAFNAVTDTITDYYDHEGNNPANPACTRDVDIPSTIGGTPVTSIGNFSFYSNQLTSVTIPSSVTSIDTYAFTSNQLTSVTIPSSVTSIDTYAFASNQLTDVTIPSSVTSIDTYAFASNQLTDVTIPNAAATMQHSSFENNPITIMTLGSTAYTKQTPTTDSACFAQSGSTVTDYYRSSPIVARDFGVLCGDNVSIPNTFTAIGNNAFSDNGLRQVTIPASVTSLGASAFYYNHLTTISIPSSVTSIGSSALRNNQLSEVTIAGDPSTLGAAILDGNPLTSISYNGILHTNAMPVADSCYVFSGGTITDYRFANLSHIKTSNEACLNPSVVIPSQIGGIPVTVLGNDSMRDAFIESAVLPSSVTTIGDRAFMNNRLESITLSNNLTHIDWYAFYGNRLESVTIPSSVVFVEKNAFFMQHPWGGYAWNEMIENVPYVWTSDPGEFQEIFDAIWYVRLITADPANPNNLQDSVINENYDFGYDVNQNGKDDSLGGHLINPANVNMRYIDASDAELSTSSAFTGQLEDDTYLSSYLANQGPLLPVIVDIMNLTPAEQAELDEALSSYYRIGDSVSIDPPAIDGYLTPPAQTFVLGAADNTFSYVYSVSSSALTGTPSASGGLAATGASLTTTAALASLLSLGGMISIFRNFRRR